MNNNKERFTETQTDGWVQERETDDRERERDGKIARQMGWFKMRK